MVFCHRNRTVTMTFIITGAFNCYLRTYIYKNTHIHKIITTYWVVKDTVIIDASVFSLHSVHTESPPTHTLFLQSSRY